MTHNIGSFYILRCAPVLPQPQAVDTECRAVQAHVPMMTVFICTRLYTEVQ